MTDPVVTIIIGFLHEKDARGLERFIDELGATYARQKNWQLNYSMNEVGIGFDAAVVLSMVGLQKARELITALNQGLATRVSVLIRTELSAPPAELKSREGRYRFRPLRVVEDPEGIFGSVLPSPRGMKVFVYWGKEVNHLPTLNFFEHLLGPSLKG